MQVAVTVAHLRPIHSANFIKLHGSKEGGEDDGMHETGKNEPSRKQDHAVDPFVEASVNRLAI
jgi:hypothetical protein